MNFHLKVCAGNCILFVFVFLEFVGFFFYFKKFWDYSVTIKCLPSFFCFKSSQYPSLLPFKFLAPFWLIIVVYIYVYACTYTYITKYNLRDLSKLNCDYSSILCLHTILWLFSFFIKCSWRKCSQLFNTLLRHVYFWILGCSIPRLKYTSLYIILGLLFEAVYGFPQRESQNFNIWRIPVHFSN